MASVSRPFAGSRIFNSPHCRALSRPHRRRHVPDIHSLKLPSPCCRQFVTPPWSQVEAQTLTASRTLSYPASALYDIVADVEAYSSFLPYCQGSRVTRWSGLDSKHARRWPHEAEIRVGWSGLEELFISEIYCQPPYVVEAVIGDAEKTIPSDDIPHYDFSSTKAEGRNDPSAARNAGARDTSLLQHLYSRWTLRPFPYKPPSHADNPLDGNALARPVQQTDVMLQLRFQFANPVYAAMSKAVAPKVASTMVEAFARRAREVLGEPAPGPSTDGQERRSKLEGVIPGKGI